MKGKETKRGFSQREKRSKSDLMAGLPSFLIVLASIPLLTYVWYREEGLVERYRAEARSAFAAGDFEQAALAFDRLVRLEPTDHARYNLAISLIESGNRPRGIKLMQRLAPDQTQGYPPAHIWQARALIEENPERELDKLLRATNHLVKVRDTSYNDGEIDFLLSNCYWHSGSIQKSLESLRDAAQRDSKYYYDLFRSCQTVGLQESTDAAAVLAAEYYKNRVAEVPLDRLARARYAELLTWLKSFEQAHAVLQQGIYLDPNGNWKEVTSQVYLARFRQGKSEQADPDDLLNYLERAFDANPQSVEVLEELTAFGIDDESGRVEDILENALTQGKHSALVHFVLGSRAWQLDNVDDGVFHMRRAYEMDNRLAFAANNLAYYETMKDDGDFERGLAIINDVLEKFPNTYAFRETRGQLLTKLQRWKEALTDLEYALPAFPKEKRLHESLAACYRELGQASLAKRHAELAQQSSE